MPTLDKYQILAADDLPIRSMDVPEWGGQINLRTLNVKEALEFHAKKKSLDNDLDRPLLLAYTICDEARQPIFSPDEIDLLAAKNPFVVIRIFEEAVKLNTMSAEDDEIREGNS